MIIRYKSVNRPSCSDLTPRRSTVWITRSQAIGSRTCFRRRLAAGTYVAEQLPAGRWLRSGKGRVGFDKAGHVELLGDRRVGKLRSDLVPFVRQIGQQLPLRGPERKILPTRVLVLVFLRSVSSRLCREEDPRR